jgi:hypothetical protein
LGIVIKGEVFNFRFDGQPKTLDMNLMFDPSTKPKGVDFAPTVREGQVADGIYELDAGIVVPCSERPRKLGTLPSPTRSLTIHRAARQGGGSMPAALSDSTSYHRLRVEEVARASGTAERAVPLALPVGLPHVAEYSHLQPDR